MELVKVDFFKSTCITNSNAQKTMDFENISRRSFLKTTTVLTVGVASVTLFSGLVSALDSNYLRDRMYVCSLKKVDSGIILIDGLVYDIQDCSCPHPSIRGGKNVKCSTWPEWSEEQQKMIFKVVHIDCTSNNMVQCIKV